MVREAGGRGREAVSVLSVSTPTDQTLEKKRKRSGKGPIPTGPKPNIGKRESRLTAPPPPPGRAGPPPLATSPPRGRSRCGSRGRRGTGLRYMCAYKSVCGRAAMQTERKKNRNPKTHIIIRRIQPIIYTYTNMYAFTLWAYAASARSRCRSGVSKRRRP